MLAKMRYKSFVWPNNPETYTLQCARTTVVHKIPFGGSMVQDLGDACTILRGNGEFFGAGAYDTFRRLQKVFSGGGAGVLFHPILKSKRAYFTKLELTQKPCADHVAYSFEFCCTEETAQADEAKNAERWHVVSAGETVWSVCADFDIPVQEFVKLNPHIGDVGTIVVGQEVRVG